ncbi:cytochrome P450 [Myxosarcina sp. GI1]|uniref:cytochrome P450 n=1 Tax=Myxosarcina sp. GI1 TaxID=1541065 RepID=UPI0005665BD5|nr:cytochrome P450 [Myxosarcina sp. GI1]
MKQQQGDVTILAKGQATPKGTTTPPRKAKWYDTFVYIADPAKFCQQNLKKYGAVFNTGVFGGNTIFVGSPQAIQMVFNGDSQYTEIFLPDTTMDMFGEYSLFQRPDLHKERKSALKPGLTGSVLAGYIPQINKIIINGLNNWTEGKISLYPAVEKICFEILVPLLLGVDINEANPSFKGLPLSSPDELKSLYQTYFDGFYGLVKWKLLLTAYGRGLKARAKLLEFMRAVIAQRRAASAEIDPQADFLAMMLVSQQENPDGVFSDALIENQCLLQLWASHYEISGLISSLIYLLGKHSQVLEKLRAEQQEIGIESQANTLSREKLQQMSFLEVVIKETLRILPPTSTANRRLTKSVIVEGTLYPQGSTVIAEPRLAHIMPEHFERPEMFEPERFLPPRNEGRMYEYIPFGGGVHACLGAQMAMIITKIFASQLIQLFDWQLIGEPSFVQFPIKRIKDNYQIKLQKR